ncbi:hypothetical protein SDC9_125380 [bioreactor metagenome]|uniref:Uncharacterized protein n=1 Tax=bioreactor metagenome TaxID=1076179 RepID=A0A645CN92_9ZZZZ
MEHSDYCLIRFVFLFEYPFDASSKPTAAVVRFDPCGVHMLFKQLLSQQRFGEFHRVFGVNDIQDVHLVRKGNTVDVGRQVIAPLVCGIGVRSDVLVFLVAVVRLERRV